MIKHQAKRVEVMEERTRIARDLHDTLEQGLTGLSLQLKAVETTTPGLPTNVQEPLLAIAREAMTNAVKHAQATAIAATISEFPQARVLVISNYDGDEDIALAMGAGAAGYLFKSIVEDEMLNAVREAIHRGFLHLD
jgi:signal transduction histidine kinase